MADPSNTKWRVIRIAIKLVVFIVVLYFVWQSMASGFEKLSAESLHLDAGWLLLAGATYLLSLFPPFIFWLVILNSFAQQVALQKQQWAAKQETQNDAMRELNRLRPLAVLRAYYTGHLGKYVPGKGMVIVIRTHLLSKTEIPSRWIVVSVFLETLTMLAVGAFIAVAISIALMPKQPGLAIGGAAIMLCSGLPTLPPVFHWLIQRMPFLRKPPKEDIDKIAEQTDAETPHAHMQSSWRLCGLGWVLSIVCWIFMGASLWVVVGAIAPDIELSWTLFLYCTAAVSLGMTAGFLSGLPGGIGVRDGLVALILTQIVPEETALVAAIVLRLVWIIAEVVISGILYIIGWWLPDHGKPVLENHE